MTPAPGQSTSDRELAIERIFDAPPELVFMAWSSVEHMQKWASPDGTPPPHMEMDFRVGGFYRTGLSAGDGGTSWVGGRYLEIVEPERIVFTHAWDDEDANPGHETTVTITFTPHEGNRTLLRMHQATFDSPEAAQGHMGGWNSTMDNLPAYLATLQR